jgi:cation:H+ antiporter
MIIMSTIAHILILVISLLVLAKSADLVVNNLVKLANHLRWSTFIVSFIILGAASSTPELFVGINSVLENTPQLSLGNIMGATVVLLGLIAGLTAALSGKVVLEASFTTKDLLIMNFIIALPLLLLMDGKLTRFDSLIMIVAYFVYVIRIYNERDKLAHRISLNRNIKIKNTVFLLVIGLVALAVAANYAVDSALAIAQIFQIPPLMIGILLFSIGTNFPELTIALTSVRRKQKTIVLGNVMGSATTNTLVLAFVALLRPFEIADFSTFIISALFLILTIVSFSIFVKSKNEISRKEGIALLCLYSLFVISEIVSKLL